MQIILLQSRVACASDKNKACEPEQPDLTALVNEDCEGETQLLAFPQAVHHPGHKVIVA